MIGLLTQFFQFFTEAQDPAKPSFLDRIKAFFGGSIAREQTAEKPQKTGIVETVTKILTAGQQRDIDTLARTLWGEARGEGVQGMHAVANVIMNRHRLRKYGQGWPSFGPVGASVADICRAPWQFSAWNPNDPNRAKLLTVDETDITFRHAKQIAAAAVRGELPDITGGADHYHTKAVAPSWSEGQKPVAQIGGHKFFKLIPGALV